MLYNHVTYMIMQQLLNFHRAGAKIIFFYLIFLQPLNFILRLLHNHVSYMIM